jgi:hypothetical protein
MRMAQSGLNDRAQFSVFPAGPPLVGAFPDRRFERVGRSRRRYGKGDLRNEPPPFLDGARVVYWAWWPDPFFVMRDPEGNAVAHVYGLAICRYDDSGAVYRFSCDQNWEVLNDSPYGTEEEARSAASGDYDVARIAWERMSGAGP